MGRAEHSRGDQTNHSLHAVAFMSWDSSRLMQFPFLFLDVWTKPSVKLHVIIQVIPGDNLRGGPQSLGAF